MNRVFLIPVFFFCFLFLHSPAQQSPSPSGSASAAQPVSAYALPPDKLQKSEALYKLDQRLLIFGTMYSFLVLMIVLSSGLAARFRDWTESVARWRFLQAWIFVPLLLLALALADLPLRLYSHHIGLQYGLSVQGWASWLQDWGTGQFIMILILAPVLWLIQAVIRRSPRYWWFHVWLVSLPLIVFFTFITPLVIDPFFNKFEPLESKNPKLVEAIESVVQRAGMNIPRDRMYAMKASEKVTTLNAYVTGFGASKRVVVWDTTIRSLTTPETLFVFGHEMGHYVLHHILRGLAVGSVGLLIGLYLLFHLSAWTLKRFGPRWRIPALHDWAAFAMFALLLGVLGFFADPLGNAYSRHLEHQADIYGLEVTHGINPGSQQVAAHTFQLLGELSLDYPYPSRLAVFWEWTHPPIADRVRFALDYDPWDKDETARYVK